MELSEPKRILILGDTHGNGFFTTKAIRYAAENGCDTIVQVGDFGVGWKGTPEFLSRVQGALRDTNTTLYWIDGNHDHFPNPGREAVAHAGYPRITHLPRGFRWRWWGADWMALGGAASVDRLGRTPGVSWWPEEILSDEDVEYASRPGNVDVIVSHDVPYGVNIPSIGIGEPNTGSGWPLVTLIESGEHRRKVRRVVDAVRPKRVLAGHYHVGYQAYGELPGGDRFLVTGLNCDDSSIERATLILDKPCAAD